VQKDGDVFGDGVNIAARLQSLAEPDSICISDVVYRDVAKKLDLGTVVSLGRPKLKNIAERFEVYALLSETTKSLQQTLHVQQLKWSRRLRPVVFVLVSVLLLGGIISLRSPSFLPLSTQDSAPKTQVQLALPDKPSIVVLPFNNMSEDLQQAYFSDGITEVLTADLSRISSLFVIARNTAFTYKGKATNVQDVGRELGVRYALEGSVQKTSEQVRIVAQLIDTTTGGHLWSERYDRPFADIFAFQDDIVRKIVTTLRLQLSLIEQGALVHKTTDSVEAYDTFLRAYEYCCRLTQEANLKGRQLYEKAVALDPLYADAYAALGGTYLTEWVYQWSQDPQTLQRALELTQKAVAIDDSVPAAYGVLGSVHLFRQQYDQAIAAAERSIALNPNFADGYVGLATIFSFVFRRLLIQTGMSPMAVPRPAAPTTSCSVNACLKFCTLASGRTMHVPPSAVLALAR
jgi:adenylate cyclase